ncbi:tripartite tricarboxylate transporter TctB family protein [Paracoccaceae bacterium GXU_MW_L88]
MGDLTRVTIDFETSHLVFPTLIGIVLAALGLAILITRRHRFAAAGGYWSEIMGRMDKTRFFGALALTLIYFIVMVPIGNIWPNIGLGFLISSIPYVFLTGVLFMHERTTRQLVLLLVIALAVPTLVWWLFTDIFYLTLP